jgi:hypothetical protein
VALRALEPAAESSARWSNGITGLEGYQPSAKAAEVSHYSNAAIVHEIVLFLGKQKGKNSPSSFKELKAVLASKQIYLGKQRLLQIVTRYRQGCRYGINHCHADPDPAFLTEFGSGFRVAYTDAFLQKNI